MVKQNADETMFLNNLALFYFKTQAKCCYRQQQSRVLLKNSSKFMILDCRMLFSELHNKLSAAGICDTEVEQIINDISKEDLMKTCNNGLLRSDATRKTFFLRTNFNYVNPVHCTLEKMHLVKIDFVSIFQFLKQ